MRIALLPLALLAATPVAAQTDHDAAIWLNATVMGPVSGKLIFFAEVQPRIGDDVDRVTQLLLRPAIGWQVSPALALYQGYAWVIDPLDGRDRVEDRSFQQATWNVGRIGRLEVQSRTRIEQRWRNDGPGMAVRARQMLRAEYPLGHGTRRPALLGWSEAFVGLKSARWGGITGFDQLRTFAGVELPLTGTSTAEIGYLNQTRDAAGRRVGMTHAAAVTLFMRL